MQKMLPRYVRVLPASYSICVAFTVSALERKNCKLQVVTTSTLRLLRKRVTKGYDRDAERESKLDPFED
jgi:hypothetical protein